MRVNDEACFIQMTAVNSDTIRHGATSGARTNAFLSYGNGYLTTSNGNVIVSESCTDLCRAGMFVSTNESNYLVRFFNEASGSSSDYMTVRYDYQNGDGEVNIKDVSALIDYLLTGDTEGVNLANADMSQDGEVSIKDVSALIDYLLEN